MAEDQDPNVTTDPGDNDPGDGGEWTPPTKEEWEKAQRTMAARKRERDEARREAAALKEKGKPTGDGGPDPKDQADRAQAREESDNRARRAAGITALVEAGLSRAAAKEAIPLLKLKGLEVDADGDVDEEELEERVAALKAKFPGMFPGMFPAKGKIPKARTADGAGTARPTRTGTQRTNDALMRQAGYARD